MPPKKGKRPAKTAGGSEQQSAPSDRRRMRWMGPTGKCRMVWVDRDGNPVVDPAA